MPKSLRDKMAELPPERRAKIETEADRLQARDRSSSSALASAPAEADLGGSPSGSCRASNPA